MNRESAVIPLILFPSQCQVLVIIHSILPTLALI
jgi:hypothetical protein